MHVAKRARVEPEEGPLALLPPELIAEIAGNLAPPDFARLAVTSRRLFAILRSGYPLIKSPRTTAISMNDLARTLIVAEHRRILHEGPQPVRLLRVMWRDTDGNQLFCGVPLDHSRGEPIIAFGTVVYVKRRPGPPVFDCKTSTLYVGKTAKIAWNNILAVATYFPRDRKLTWFIWNDPLKPPTVKIVERWLYNFKVYWKPALENDLYWSMIPTCQYTSEYRIYRGLVSLSKYYIIPISGAGGHIFRDIAAPSLGNSVCATCLDNWAVMLTNSHALIGDMSRDVSTHVFKFSRRFFWGDDCLILRNDGLMILNENGRLREWWVFARA
jgi:hypothetical protein